MYRRAISRSSSKANAERQWRQAAHFSTAQPASPREPLGAGFIFFSGLTFLTTGLSIWQMMRYQEKIDLLAKRAASLSADPVNLSEAKARAEAQGAGTDRESPRRVTVQGVYDAASNVRIFPRSSPPGTPPHLLSLSSANGGYTTITPMRTRDGGRVAVLRGWAPADVPTPTPPQGEVCVVGVLRSGEPGGTFAVRSQTHAADGTPILSLMDMHAVAEAAGMGSTDGGEPLLVECIEPFPERSAVRSGSAAPWPVTRQLDDVSGAGVPPSTHLVYAGTWGTLAVCGVFLTARRFGLAASLLGGAGKRQSRRLVKSDQI